MTQTSRDWLAGWSRHARLLVEVEIPESRAALVDTNADGRELWFGLDLRGPDGQWVPVMDEDDTSTQCPLSTVDGTPLIYGWGTAAPRERKKLSYLGSDYEVKVGSNGWWLLLARHL